MNIFDSFLICHSSVVKGVCEAFQNPRKLTVALDSELFIFLTSDSSFRMLKRTLRPAIDYKFIPETAWELLSSWYGVVKGQPPVGEKVKRFYFKKVYNAVNNFCWVDTLKILFHQ